ncbi:hypothetical protein E3O42_11080 [Cryobacterium adonitolivorans]|uniref:Uncharacterized protein n=1 Tax=Cryobacterium adonitolivorans TaxID=1259189 RepID=A0A4R8W5F4_9MICO|nr:hypothetical protein [Cryobacterium adonitolivorans]TFC01018.1 hypothetical protein E3O42_11080 [Cryobacterium adonitolivorans]
MELPDDLREGDLLAIPCTGVVALRDVLNGASLVQTSRDETPTVRIGPAGNLWAQQTTSSQRFITVLLTRVEETGFTDSHRRLVVWVDAELDHCRPNLSAARVVG